MKPLVYKKAKRDRTKRVVFQKLHLTKGDVVQVISGDDKGKQGRIIRANPKNGRITIEGINIVKRHTRATNQNQESGIIEKPAPIHHSKAMLVDPKSGAPTRIRRRKDSDGTVERISLRSGQSIPRNR
ncbi:MAG: 50S ribosomal protein L24 [Gemmatimonadota bacterium]